MITLHSDGRPYVFGGMDDSGMMGALNTVYTFERTNMWTQRAAMQQSLFMHVAVVLNADTAMVCGGLTAMETNSLQSQCYTYTIHMWDESVLIKKYRIKKKQ